MIVWYICCRGGRSAMFHWRTLYVTNGQHLLRERRLQLHPWILRDWRSGIYKLWINSHHFCKHSAKYVWRLCILRRSAVCVLLGRSTVVTTVTAVWPSTTLFVKEVLVSVRQDTVLIPIRAQATCVWRVSEWRHRVVTKIAPFCLLSNRCWLLLVCCWIIWHLICFVSYLLLTHTL